MTFEESESAMLDLYCQCAGVVNGMSVVDLGCGWGSLPLHLAEHSPNCRIAGISYSHSQREAHSFDGQEAWLQRRERYHCDGKCAVVAAGPGVGIPTQVFRQCNVAGDQGALDVVKDNDLVMTVDMKNCSHLLRKVDGFLKPSDKLFVHIFTHKQSVLLSL